MMMKKRLLGILLSFALMMGMMPALGVSQTAYADDTIWYINENGDRVETRDYVLVTNSTTGFTSSKVNVVMGSVELDGPFTVNDNAKLVLCDGAELTVEGFGSTDNGIEVTGCTFTVYAQSNGKGMGKLRSEGLNGIYITNAGILNVVGGAVTAKGLGDAEYGIDGRDGSISIKGGDVKADGAGGGIAAENLEITGGTVTADGGTYGIRASNRLTISDGTVTANADDSGQAIFTSGALTIGDKVFVMAGENEASAQLVPDPGNWQHDEKWARTAPLVRYPLWVCGVQVTNANQDDVLWDDTKNKGKVSYDPETVTLKLDGANITADKEHQKTGAAIYYEGQDKDLTINAAKASTVTATGEDSRGIYTKDKNLIFNGTLNVTGGDDGVDCNGNDITVNGKLTASGSEIGIYLDSGDITINSGAELYASGSNNSGIGVNDNTGAINIKEGARVTTVGGKYGAISGIVKNAIAGTAWTDKDGTAGETAIEVNADRDLGDKYKKVQFPAEAPVVTQYTITYDLSGGTWEGMTGIVTMDVENGTIITLPEPARDGYTFDYWEGSRYNAGDKYKVSADHTFKAVWKAADNGGGSDSGDKGGSSKKGVKTGDGNRLGAWIALLAAALGGTVGMVFARKRKSE
ncbi:MAG: InlB B-repeat-containing protein [Mogibacterium sp.]|nr:InlB B-repeat-containing protein [Mogibacterium sp.]